MAWNDTGSTGAKQNVAEHVFVLLLEMAIMWAVILSNTVVICSVLIVRKLRENVSNIFILNLSIADFCVGVLPLPLLMAAHAGWDIGEFLCSVNITFNIGLASTSAYGVMLVSLDKYIYLIHPLHYHRFMTKARARLAVVATWVASFLFAGLACMTRWNEQRTPRPWKNVYPPTCYPIKTEFVVSTAAFYVVLPGAVITYCGFHILRAVRHQLKKTGRELHHRRRISQSRERRGSAPDAETTVSRRCDEKQDVTETGASQSLKREKARTPVEEIQNITSSARRKSRPFLSVKNGIRQVSKSEMKAIKCIALLIAAFFLMWAPFFVALTAAGLCVNCRVNFRRVLAITVCLGNANSAINPMLYAKNRDFRRAYKNILSCKCCCTSSSSYRDFPCESRSAKSCVASRLERQEITDL